LNPDKSRPGFFTSNVGNHGLEFSLGTTSDGYDNTKIESFWGRIQTELPGRKTRATVVELSVAMADYIENFHDTSRCHSSPAMLTPIECKTINARQMQLS
jgi:transposase InsO family protein